ncbi:transposase, partial [Pseudomonas aeruginosa]
MTASVSPAAVAATAALAAPIGQPASAPMTRVALAYIDQRFDLYLRF